MINGKVKEKIKTDIYNKITDLSDGEYVWMGVEYAYAFFSVEAMENKIKKLESIIKQNNIKIVA